MTTEVYGCSECGAYNPDWDPLYDDEGTEVGSVCSQCGADSRTACILIESSEEDDIRRLEERNGDVVWTQE